MIAAYASVFLIVAIAETVDRILKLVKRRCPKCGSVLGIKRPCQITLGDDESISFRSPEGKRRYYIRRVDSEVFSICTKCGYGGSVKTSREPISVLHAKFHRKQFFDDPKLKQISFGNAWDRRNRKHLNLGNGTSDTPPLDPVGELLKKVEEVLDPGKSDRNKPES